MYISVIFFPFFGFFSIGLFGRYFGRQGSAFLTTFCLFLTFIISIYIFYEVCICQTIISLKLYNWLLLDIYSLEIGLLFDTISTTMLVIISCISFFVHLYSTAYMSHDPYLSRFMGYLSFFTFFMLILITSDNFFQLFIGWEGVGLCSYLLINFFFTRILANKAALKAMIMNRIADVFFIFGIIIIFLTFKTTDFIVVFNLLPFINNENIIFLNVEINIINLVAFFLFIGAIGKSAQIGLHTWLPVAMEGPTPVSALLHAATMVTAGVFLVIRSSVFFEYSNFILILLCVFGSITALFSGIVATFQYDIKRIIAYSTCSQLGYMFFSCGLSNYFVAFFHLFNHAFFKALLFLSAGALIHALFDEQDIRKMGDLFELLPIIYISILIGSLAILGFPFLSGFYSKDLILELIYSRYILDSIYLYFIGVVAAIFTAIYSFKLIYFVFCYEENNNYYPIFRYWVKQTAENWDNMFISLSFLIILSILSGYFFNDMFLGYGSPFWNNSIFLLNSHFNFIDIEFIHPLIKNLPIILCLIFARLFLWIFNNIDNADYLNYFVILNYYYSKIAPLFYYALFFDKLYNLIYQNIINYTYLISSKYLDKGLLELIGPWGGYKSFKYLNEKLNTYITSLIFFHIFMFFFGFFIMILSIIFFFFLQLNIIINHLGIIIILIILLFYF